MVPGGGVAWSHRSPHLAPEEHIAHLGDFAEERYGRMLVPYAGYVFTAFQYSYNSRWLVAIERLEQWLRDNDDRLEKLQPSVG